MGERPTIHGLIAEIKNEEGADVEMCSLVEAMKPAEQEAGKRLGDSIVHLIEKRYAANQENHD